MNQFLMKNLKPISSSKNQQSLQQDQTDFQRLIDLCNSYGLNQQQTKQLLQQFKKGSYQSGNNSLNQSIVSEQQSMYSQQKQQQDNQKQSKLTFQSKSKGNNHNQSHNGYYNRKQNIHNEHQQSSQYEYEQCEQEGVCVGVDEQTYSINHNNSQMNSQKFIQSRSTQMNQSRGGHAHKQSYDTQKNHTNNNKNNSKKGIQQKPNNKSQIIQQPKRNVNSYLNHLKHQQQQDQQQYQDQDQEESQSYNEMTFNQLNLVNEDCYNQTINNGNGDYKNKNQDNNVNVSRSKGGFQQKNIIINQKQLSKQVMVKRLSDRNSHHLLLQNQQNCKNIQQHKSRVLLSQHQQKQSINPNPNQNYIEQIINKFELLQRQNSQIQQKNTILQQQNYSLNQKLKYLQTDNKSIHDINNKLKKQLQTLKPSHEQFSNLKQQLIQFKNEANISTEEVQKLNALLQSQKQKTTILLTQKQLDIQMINTLKQSHQTDKQIISTFKDSLNQLTLLVKQKDNQNNQLQNKLLALYEKISQYHMSAQSEFNRTQGSSTSSAMNLGKCGSRKGLTENNYQEDNHYNRDQGQFTKIPIQNRHSQEQQGRFGGQKSFNRKQLSQISGNGMNNSNIIASLNPSRSSKHIQLEVSDKSSKIIYPRQDTYSNSNNQRSSLFVNNSKNKQNIFAPVQVQSSFSGKQSTSVTKKNTQQINQLIPNQPVKRPSSRVDIKKYKGMIQQLRNSYTGGSITAQNIQKNNHFYK